MTAGDEYVPRHAPAREVYGRVYEVFTTRPDLDGEHPYVGKTCQTIHRRVHAGPRAHTSPESIAKDPWKARIRPGRDGYRQLEAIYATGDKAVDEASLRRAEAFWIDRLRTTHNDVRPVRPPAHEQPARTARAKPARPPSATTFRAAQTRTRRRQESAAFWIWSAMLTALVGWFLFPAPWPTVLYPLVLSPVSGFILAVLTQQAARPKRRRRTRR